jgi:hypothetical protein
MTTKEEDTPDYGMAQSDNGAPRQGNDLFRYDGQAGGFIVTFLSLMVFLGGALAHGRWPPRFSILALATPLAMWLIARFLFGSRIFMEDEGLRQKTLFSARSIAWDEMKSIAVKKGGYSHGFWISDKIIIRGLSGQKILVSSRFSHYDQLENTLESQLMKKSTVSLQEARVKAEESFLSWRGSPHLEDIPELLALTMLFVVSLCLAVLWLR